MLTTCYGSLPDTCLVVLVIVPDHLSDIMLHVYLLLYPIHVTLSVVAYYSCICAYILFSVYLAYIITVYAPHRILVR